MSTYLTNKSPFGTSKGYTSQHVNAKKFAMWLAIGSITMMFASMTSAYIVRRGDTQNWQQFELPQMFLVSTIVILLSSGLLHWAYISFKQHKNALFKTLMGLSALSGVAFIILQYWGWMQLKEMGIFLSGNVSGSFVYVISGIHAAHVIGGVISLLYGWIRAINVTTPPSGPEYAKRKERIEMTATYWHFVDLLWVYLYIFFLINY